MQTQHLKSVNFFITLLKWGSVVLIPLFIFTALLTTHLADDNIYFIISLLFIIFCYVEVFSKSVVFSLLILIWLTFILSPEKPFELSVEDKISICYDHNHVWDNATQSCRLDCLIKGTQVKCDPTLPMPK